MFGERVRERFRLVVGDRGVERNVNLQPFRAGSFGPAFQFHPCQNLAQPEPNLTALHDVGRRAGIEIEDHHGRARHVFFARERGVQFDVGEVGRPDERRQILREAILHLALVPFAPDLGGLDPARAMLGQFFS